MKNLFCFSSSNSHVFKKNIGEIFELLKLNPKLVIEKELSGCLKKRNLLFHGFRVLLYTSSKFCKSISYSNIYKFL